MRPNCFKKGFDKATTTKIASLYPSIKVISVLYQNGHFVQAE
jgi:hypothetical protein